LRERFVGRMMNKQDETGALTCDEGGEPDAGDGHQPRDAHPRRCTRSRSREARTPRRCRVRRGSIGFAFYPDFSPCQTRLQTAKTNAYTLNRYHSYGQLVRMVMTKVSRQPGCRKDRARIQSNQISERIGSVTKRRAGGRRKQGSGRRSPRGVHGELGDRRRERPARASSAERRQGRAVVAIGQE